MSIILSISNAFYGLEWAHSISGPKGNQCIGVLGGMASSPIRKEIDRKAPLGVGPWTKFGSTSISQIPMGK